MQPLIINLAGKRVVIAGGGRIAARKAKVLEAEQAKITFVAPEFSEEVLKLTREKGYILIKRYAEPADFTSAMLVILATNDRAANGTLAQALPDNQLVCVVDESGEGNVTFPATVRRGHLQIAITSNASSPKLTRKLKLELERQFDESWDSYTLFLSRCRDRIKKLEIPFDKKNELIGSLLDEKYRLDAEAQLEKWRELDQLGMRKQLMQGAQDKDGGGV
ncbi:NAD(P)-dependent oxidoreductase [Mesobacillus harenae]|uniref:NAD(P)-dependent oxidoreductase n=1 Tax=Mesobacillus harenae TaxID=2213203 RepID=UPI00158012D4|nr:NAD(P)-dependent oxidoreductase [Mesobacillus harenae]